MYLKNSLHYGPRNRPDCTCFSLEKAAAARGGRFSRVRGPARVPQGLHLRELLAEGVQGQDTPRHPHSTWFKGSTRKPELQQVVSLVSQVWRSKGGTKRIGREPQDREFLMWRRTPLCQNRGPKRSFQTLSLLTNLEKGSRGQIPCYKFHF